MAIPIQYNLRNVVQRPIATLTTALGIALTVAGGMENRTARFKKNIGGQGAGSSQYSGCC